MGQLVAWVLIVGQLVTWVLSSSQVSWSHGCLVIVGQLVAWVLGYSRPVGHISAWLVGQLGTWVLGYSGPVAGMCNFRDYGIAAVIAEIASFFPRSRK